MCPVEPVSGAGSQADVSSEISTNLFLMLNFPVIKAEICLLKCSISQLAPSFLFPVHWHLDAVMCLRKQRQTIHGFKGRQNWSFTDPCITDANSCHRLSWHHLGYATWMLPAPGIHHLDYSQASHFQKPAALMDEMASPRGPAAWAVILQV